ncbi:enamine deaminase RidA [Rhodobacteraceae bacterium (ex Bugula neritina AB1)]|nr:enamine deaminase RidA [Chromatiales bacterium (ex Bugula neritina AB1)]OED50442.1 enamine deaminase RidA [Rhodobacteraceae bacterium (ex Bugula neritina AB1)]
MAIDSFNPTSVWTPFGAFSQAVVQGAGKIVHLKGQVSLDIDGNVVGAGDLGAQVEKSLENIQSVLAEFGGQMEDIYSLVHHVTDIKGFMETGAIRKRYFKPPFPVTTTVEVSRLYHPDLLVEITSSAEIPLARYVEPHRNSI